MSMLPVVATTDSLVIRQRKELTEVFNFLNTARPFHIELSDERGRDRRAGRTDAAAVAARAGSGRDVSDRLPLLRAQE
jgi:hypothetical protein